MTRTLYMLQYDVDYGDRENWNVIYTPCPWECKFYTPCEVFDSAEARMKRVEYIMANSEDYASLEENFIMTDLKLMSEGDYNAPIINCEDDEDEF